MKLGNHNTKFISKSETIIKNGYRIKLPTKLKYQQYKYGHKKLTCYVCCFCGEIIVSSFCLSHIKGCLILKTKNTYGTLKNLSKSNNFNHYLQIKQKKILKRQQEKEKLYTLKPKAWVEINATCKNSLFYEGD